MVTIELKFGAVVLEAELFDTKISKGFAAHLPYRVNLMQWGREVYGPIGLDLGEEKPVAEIPAGGVAYTRQGGYVCIFFGQTPAWPVEYIGRIPGEGWKALLDLQSPGTVTIRRKKDGQGRG